MTVLKVIGIILLVFLLIGFLRLGAIVSFGDELRVRLRVGAIKLTVFPGKDKKRGKNTKEKKNKAEKKEEEEEGTKKKREFPKLSLDEVLDLAQTAFSALGTMAKRAGKRVRIDPLEVTLIFGGPDPSRAATAFGMANAAVFSLMPKAEEVFYIPDPSLHLRVDFDAEGTTAVGDAGLSLRVCDLFAILFTLVLPMGKWLLRFKKAHKGDKRAHQGAPEAINSEEKINELKDTKEQIA